MNTKIISLIITGLIAALLLPACGSNSEEAMNLQERSHAAESLDSRIVQAENAFGLQLHRQLTELGDGGNVILSPYSISTALAMTWNGSAGATASEMADVLGWNGMDVEQINEGNKQLAKLLSGSADGIELQTANSLWYREGIAMKKSFLEMSQNVYRAKVTELDLSGDDALDRINNWVREQTQHKIDSIIDNPIDPSTVAILVNAVYFNGTWKLKFSEDATKEEDFTLEDGSVEKVPMMKQNGQFPYLEGDTWQAVRLPYGDGRLDMLVVLPKPESSLDELQTELWADPSPWQQAFPKALVELGLPRFKVKNTMLLNDALEQLGMKKAFDREAADFSGMADVRPLFIGAVKHKTYIDVNEEGTEAAAVTSVEMVGTSAPATSATMVVNRPFFFAIEDAQTHAWLFLGSVTNPLEE
ncbi:serpin family protein [Paenibacillus sp. HB172176]|uniref:serpin family protein n=1 Tax=Paenibacillus sp. HB172176 TaxID=2493690 RepID=UPI00143A5D87|nr:serpin family protein [Paenibacillus sp. HB172176]